MSDDPADAAADGLVLLAGAGQMGGAMLSAWLDAGVPAARLAVIDPQPSVPLASRLVGAQVALNPPAEAGRHAAVLILAVKPQVLDQATPGLRPFVGPETVVVSVLAGKTLADLRRAFPEAGATVRAMPNTPAAIRRGITGVAAEAKITDLQRASVQQLLSAVGQVEWLDDEALIDAVTAVSGSGPAYVFHLAECLAQAGVAAGLDPVVAARLARATVEGAGALMAQRPDDMPETLRRNVTSPGGTTAAALAVLMRDQGLAPLMEAAVAAAKQRAGELSG